MKKTITLSAILFLFVGMTNAQFVEGWKKIHTGISENIYGICCVDSCTVIACGENGKILKSTNKGDSWITTFEKEGYDLIHVDFADENVGYAWGDSSIYNGNHKGIIVKTIDGGTTWQELENTEFATLYNGNVLQLSKMLVVNPTTFSIFNGQNAFWWSSDGGQTFDTIAIGTVYNYPSRPVCYSELAENNGVFYFIVFLEHSIGTFIQTYQSYDNGQNWYNYGTFYYESGFGEPVVTCFAHGLEIFSSYEFNYQWGPEYYDTFNGSTFVQNHYLPFPYYPGGYCSNNKAKFTSDTYGCVLVGCNRSDGSIKWAPYIARNGFNSLFSYVPYGIPSCDENGLNCTNLFDLDGIDTTFFIASTDGIIFKTAMVPMNGGQEWYYEITNENGDVTFQHLEYANDTTINNDKAKVIVRTNQIYDKEGHTETTHEYIKEEDNKVYWWNKAIQEFTILYDYDAEEGDEWEIKVGQESITVHVDHVSVLEYEGESYKMLSISDAGSMFDGDIICGIGHTTSFFPERLMNQGKDYDVDGLRCYWLGEVLVYHNGDEDCDAIHSSFTSIGDANTDGFWLYPNPTDGLLHIVGLPQCDSPTGQTEYRITNLMGQTLLTGILNGETIDISALSNGVYLLKIKNSTFKIVVNQ